MINLITGYKRTGKDTLIKMLNGQEAFNWIVYVHPNSPNRFIIEPNDRISFADKLRQEVNDILNIPDPIDYDAYKETIIRDGKTYRDFLIEHAAKRRNEDVNYWLNKATDWDNINSNSKISITDWRYPNELEFLNKLKHLTVTTIRLYRSEVPIPPANVSSEHQLDDILTDFLFVSPNKGEFEKACLLFPQYKDYVSIVVNKI